eukprot:TRINITY_DN470_c0_g1_i1.p1 TRINITY_DN470_c0_g1~~TRINITY_DN470_c0_g1_i1.p1  ORF type:complete len:319 (-),score=64.54 TRINITY_DN470_c0_g1_i1:36-992(-)
MSADGLCGVNHPREVNDSRRRRSCKVDEKADWAEKHQSNAEILLFVLDRSTSMAWNDEWLLDLFGFRSGSSSRLFVAKTFIMTLIKQLFGQVKYQVPDNAAVELLTFGTDVSDVLDVRDVNVLKKTLVKIQPDQHHSAVFDAVYKAIQIAQTYPQANTRIVVLTDGGETNHSDKKKIAAVEAELGLEDCQHFRRSYWSRCLQNVMICCVGSPAGQGQAKKFADRYGMEYMAVTSFNLNDKATQVKSEFLSGMFNDDHCGSELVSEDTVKRIRSLGAATPNALAPAEADEGSVVDQETLIELQSVCVLTVNARRHLVNS